MKQEGKVLGGNCNVVHVDSDCHSSGFMLSDSVTVQRVYHSLERSRRISEAKEHYSGFVESPLCFECSLMFISCLNADIVVSSSHIQLCINHGPSQVLDQCGDEGEQVLVPHCPFINILVILYWS